jgi:hypothetical protein
MEKRTVHIFGSTSFTKELFDRYYVGQIIVWMEQGAKFVIGGAAGVDTFAQQFLSEQGYDSTLVTVYDKQNQDNRVDKKFNHVNGFESYTARDAAMTCVSTDDICVMHQYGGGGSGSFANLIRRRYGDKVSKEIIKMFREHSTDYNVEELKALGLSPQ